jgi:ribosomal protein S18 acetylase RimI-like enzyme
MNGVLIRKATASDAERLNTALENLSRDLGDSHFATADDLVRHGFGAVPAFFALVAGQHDNGALRGALIASPVFSTSLGGAGLYVSDLWVSDTARGQGLGPRLLQAAIAEAPADWTIRFLKLAVHNHNNAARRFYERLGFEDLPDETVLALKGDALETLRNQS